MDHCEDVLYRRVSWFMVPITKEMESEMIVQLFSCCQFLNRKKIEEI